nr:c-type cytochrome [Legionella beliardensis]
MINAATATTHHPEEFLSKIHGTKDEGRQIVQHFCATCHAKKPLIALGAPRINNKTDWEPRIAQGLAKLLAHTAEGYGAMPARGGCFECSDEQLQLAILAMLPVSLKNKLNNELKENK